MELDDCPCGCNTRKEFKIQTITGVRSPFTVRSRVAACLLSATYLHVCVSLHCCSAMSRGGCTSVVLTRQRDAASKPAVMSPIAVESRQVAANMRTLETVRTGMLQTKPRIRNPREVTTSAHAIMTPNGAVSARVFSLCAMRQHPLCHR